MTKEDILVRYEYAKKTKVIEKHIDIKTGMLLEPEKIYEGYVGKEYEILSKEFEGYVLVEENIPEKSKGEMTKEIIIVEYYYIHKGKVIVEYIDKYSGEILKDKVEADINEDGIIDDGEFEEKDSTIIIEGLEGDEYKTSANEFDNYKLVENEIPLNKEGFMIKDEIKVTYKYVHKSIGVKEEHRDAITGELLEDVIIHEGYEGDVYNVLDKEINNYDLDESRKPNNSSGKMTKEEIVVTYYYVRKTEVIVQYLNEETEESLSEEKVIKGHVGDNYKTEHKNIEG